MLNSGLNETLHTHDFRCSFDSVAEQTHDGNNAGIEESVVVTGASQKKRGHKLWVLVLAHTAALSINRSRDVNRRSTNPARPARVLKSCQWDILATMCCARGQDLCNLGSDRAFLIVLPQTFYQTVTHRQKQLVLTVQLASEVTAGPPNH